MTKIDFTQPLELTFDGTPVKLDTSRSDNPDAAGDYYLVREDGHNFTMAQTGESFDDNVLIVRPDGRQWVYELRDRPPVIRNRQPDFWGPEIEVNGVKPTWLRPEDRVRWYGPGMTDQWWDRNASGGVTTRGLCWDATITHIRLPADHFAYVAIERGFEPWSGGILFRCGDTQTGDCWNWEHSAQASPSGGTHHIIGYRKKVADQPQPNPVEEIDWNGDLEAVRISDGFTMPVTLAYGPDADGDYITNECPDSSRTNREWRADGSDRCFYGEWKVRNRAAVKPVAVTMLTDADIEAAEAAWLDDRSDDTPALFFARHWGLLAPKPETIIDRFMAAHPEADRSTAQLALGWSKD